MAAVIVEGSLMFAYANRKLPKITEVKQFATLYDEFQKDSIEVTFEAMKTPEGTSRRFEQITELWEAGIQFLVGNIGKITERERSIVALGLRTLRMSMDALLGNLMLLKRPELRDMIRREQPQPGGASGS